MLMGPKAGTDASPGPGVASLPAKALVSFGGPVTHILQ